MAGPSSTIWKLGVLRRSSGESGFKGGLAWMVMGRYNGRGKLERGRTVGRVWTERLTRMRLSLTVRIDFMSRRMAKIVVQGKLTALYYVPDHASPTSDD